MFYRATFAVIAPLLLAGAFCGTSQHRSETEWCRILADQYGAVCEVRLWDGTRCDLVTDTEAIEVDWAKNGKWAEAIGQASYYAILLHREPAILLLVEDHDSQARYVYRCQTVCAKLGIKLYVEDVP